MGLAIKGSRDGLGRVLAICDDCSAHSDEVPFLTKPIPVEDMYAHTLETEQTFVEQGWTKEGAMLRCPACSNNQRD